MEFDNDGQPYSRLNFRRRESRTTEEVLGFLRGIMADGRLEDQEIRSAYRLLLERQADLPAWLFGTLASRVYRALQDDRIEEEERMEIACIIEGILGSKEAVADRFSTQTVLTRPEPEVIFDQNEFVLTGKFVYGPRHVCEEEIRARGGVVGSNVTLRTSYLVVGTLGSRDWVNTAFGTKIQKAMEYRERRGAPIAIISEQRWVEFL